MQSQESSKELQESPNGCQDSPQRASRGPKKVPRKPRGPKGVLSEPDGSQGQLQESPMIDVSRLSNFLMYRYAGLGPARAPTLSGFGSGFGS